MGERNIAGKRPLPLKREQDYNPQRIFIFKSHPHKGRGKRELSRPWCSQRLGPQQALGGVLDRFLHLVEGAHFDLADALA